MSFPILSVAEMRAWEERTWAAGITPESVIRRAGEAVARMAERWIRPGAAVLVLAGGGHNGDDAWIAGQALSGRAVRCVRVGGPGSFEEATRWLEAHRGDPLAWVIDGLFGIGLNRPLAGEWAVLVAAIQASGLRVLAVDVPSGLDADRGEAWGSGAGSAVRADVTVTLGAVKRGLLREAAAEYVGRIELAADIGLVPASGGGRACWSGPQDFNGYPGRRAAGGHKGTFGHVGIVAGSLGYHGAAVLAAQGAARARPGLVTVFTEDRCHGPVAGQLRSAMVRPWGGEPLEWGGITAWVVGPGLASSGLAAAVRREVRRLWKEASCPVVADASALDWLSDGSPGEGAGLRVVTPHPGEAGRMLGCTAADVQSDRWTAADRLAAWMGGAEDRRIVVLKGRHTVVRGPDGRFWVNASGNAGLAQGGTGDVLAGGLGGMLAQPALAGDPVRAVRFGVWRHGDVADRLEERGGAWTTEDLVAALGEPRG